MANGGEGDERFKSRKWKLARGGLAMYTAVHVVNILLILYAAAHQLLPKPSVEILWAGSVTTWSVGVGAIILIYMGGNVADAAVGKMKGGS